MDAGVGLRAKPGAWAGLGNPRRSSTARVPVRFAVEKFAQPLVLGSDRRSCGAKLKVSCSRKPAGIDKTYYSADEALVLKVRKLCVIVISFTWKHVHLTSCKLPLVQVYN
jgi:hypothetical protein